MNKIGLLVINYFNNYIGSFSISKGKTKYTIGGALILVFGIVFIFLFASMAISTMESTLAIINDPTLNLTDLEIKDYLQMPLYVNAGMLMMFTLLLTITKATSSKKNQDEDLLLSLPVTKTQIVTSKILFNYFFDFGMIASTILPSFIVYYVMCPTKLDIFYFGRVAFVILLIPMLSKAIGTLIGVLITFLTRKFVKANAIRSIIAVFFLVIFLFGYYALQFYIEIVAKTDINFSMSDIFVLKGIVEFVLGNSWLLYGIIIFLVCFIPFLICVLVSAISIGKHTKAHNSKKKELKFNKSSIVKTLFDQEIGKYFGSSVYVMNTLFGGIILIIISIIFAILGPNFITEKILTLMPANDIVEKIFVNLPFFIIGGTSLIISTIAISCVSISLFVYAFKFIQFISL